MNEPLQCRTQRWGLGVQTPAERLFFLTKLFKLKPGVMLKHAKLCLYSVAVLFGRQEKMLAPGAASGVPRGVRGVRTAPGDTLRG